MKKGGLTLTLITHRATSLNYGESIGNVSVLKKITLADNTQLTYISDKALRYDMKRLGKEMFGWRLLDQRIKNYLSGAVKEGEADRKGKGKGSKKVLDVGQFGKELLKDYHEFDLFGGLFTNIRESDGDDSLELSYGDSVKRTSVVKVSYGISLSPFKSDMDFMNNIDAYNRYIKHIESKESQTIVNSEQHTSHYLYTVTVDLDRVGCWEEEDGSVEDVLAPEEKAKRVVELLEVIKNLNRQIRGRWENLSPVFIIGGVFSVKNPFFLDSVRALEKNGKLELDLRVLKDAIKLVPEGEKVICGLQSSVFHNEEEIRKELSATDIDTAFEELKRAVRDAYGVKV